MPKRADHATHSTNPITGTLLGHSPLHDIGDLENAMEQARTAQVKWATVKPAARSQILKQLIPVLLSEGDRLAKLISDENGKTRLDAMATEILAATLATRYYCRKAPAFLKTTGPGKGSLATFNKKSHILRVPYGVVGIISPWNYPFSIPFSEVLMALLAGNAVILKTATQTQMVGMALNDLFQATDIPGGLLATLNMPGRIAGKAFLDAGVDKLFFTGSVPVGKQLMALAAESLTPVNLELGGNDAMLVCPDADPARAAAGAMWAGFSNCGQSCGGVERIYVHADIYDRFLLELENRVKILRVGLDKGPDMDIDVGGMTTSGQVDTVRQHLDDAIAKGATVFAQATVPEDPALANLFPPTVLTEVTHDMLVMKEETFGPIIAVMKVGSMDEAVRLANDSPLGLTGSVWSRNRKRARQLGSRIRAGAITINDHLMSHGLPETAWGGFKESGIGRSHGQLGFNEMTQPQVIVDDWLPFVRRDLWWYPYSRSVYDGLKGLLQALYGTGMDRLRGIPAFLKTIPRMFKSR